MNLYRLFEQAHGPHARVTVLSATREGHADVVAQLLAHPGVEVNLGDDTCVASQISGVRLSAEGQTTTAVLVQDLDAIAMKNFKDKETSILARTAARALAKYIATEAAAAIRNPNNRAKGPQMPPRITAPKSRMRLARSKRQIGPRLRWATSTGNNPAAAPRYNRPAN